MQETLKANPYVYADNNPVNAVDPSGAITIPGIGFIDIRVYVFPLPGLGLYLTQSSATRLSSVGNTLSAVITAAIVHTVSVPPELAPFIAVAVKVLLTGIPDFVKGTCGEEGGGATINTVLPAPVPYCGPIPDVAL